MASPLGLAGEDENPLVAAAGERWEETRLALSEKKAALIKAKEEYDEALATERIAFKVYSDNRLR